MTMASAAFTPASATEIAQQAAAKVGLADQPSEMIRMGTTAVVRLPAGVVARVARDATWTEIASREVRVSAALANAGVPCVITCRVEQPVIIEEHPVTFWAEIPGPLQEPTVAELGAVLRLFHQVDDLTDNHGSIVLPRLDPWTRTLERIEQAPINHADRQVLRDVLLELQDRWTTVRFALGHGVIHGDAHLGNLVRGADGAAVLLDFDSVCLGPREWDLVPTGLQATSLGWLDRAAYASFVDAYGFDITTSPSWAVLARMRELRMTAWLATHASESDHVAGEVEHRVACLADPDLPRHWSSR